MPTLGLLLVIVEFINVGDSRYAWIPDGKHSLNETRVLRASLFLPHKFGQRIQLRGALEMKTEMSSLKVLPKWLSTLHKID